MTDIKTNLQQIREAITAAEKKYRRPPGTITLVAVSKAHSLEKIKTAIDCHQQHFSESYLQEAMLKIQELKLANLTWHYIGRIQTKKAKLIATNFAWVESVASYEIAMLLDKYRPPQAAQLNVCIQVNISKESSKAGVLTEEILPLAEKIRQLPRLQLRGLMTIPLYQKNFAEQLKMFQTLALEFEKLQRYGFPVDTLSMGMSEDYEAAIAAGATMVRIGTAIFGTRHPLD